MHEGFQPASEGGILADPMFASADFTAPGYQVACVQLEQVPEPTTTTGGLLALGGLFFIKRHSSRKVGAERPES